MSPTSELAAIIVPHGPRRARGAPPRCRQRPPRGPGSRGAQRQRPPNCPQGSGGPWPARRLSLIHI
eukprot:1104172-Alexandrium_andersonii.AAC.1